MHDCLLTQRDEYELPDAEALHAATLALMTGYAQQASSPRRFLMARKIRSNLFFLFQHPGLTPELRRVLQRLHGMWDAIVERGDGDANANASPLSTARPPVQPICSPDQGASHPPVGWLQ